jgi:hypothetical protein
VGVCELDLVIRLLFGPAKNNERCKAHLYRPLLVPCLFAIFHTLTSYRSFHLNIMRAAYSRLVVVVLLLLPGKSRSLPIQSDTGFDLNAVPVDDSDHDSPPSTSHHSTAEQASSSMALNDKHSSSSTSKPRRNGVRIRKDPHRAEVETLPHYERSVQGFFEKHGIAPKVVDDGVSIDGVTLGDVKLSYEAKEDLLNLKKRLGNAITKTKGAEFAAVEARLRALRSKLPDLKEKVDPVLAKEKARMRKRQANGRRAVRSKFGDDAAPKLRPGRRVSEDGAPPNILRVRQHRITSALKAKGKAMKRSGKDSEAAGAASTSVNSSSEVEQKPRIRAP